MDIRPQIVLFGAGKSATELIAFLIRACDQHDWHLTVADTLEANALAKTHGHPLTTSVGIDIQADASGRLELIQKASVVISMLPPFLHQLIAIDCLQAGRHLLTASYVDPSLRAMASEIRDRDLLFLCEMGLDPGIDHMSAMKAIDGIRSRGGIITSFRSHCGGLVAPESDDNPWHYKISWNPRNVVLAGKGGARYREGGQDQHIAYEDLFDPSRQVTVPGWGPLAWYPNRDSLGYAPLYGLEEIPTFIRTTLRVPGFCSGWRQVIALGLTDETPAYDTDGMTLSAFFQAHGAHIGFSPAAQDGPMFAEQLQRGLKLLGEEAALLADQLLYLGWNGTKLINKGRASAADVLQFALENQLALTAGDKDQVVMLHEIRFQEGGKMTDLTCTLIVTGTDPVHTAMARTVGLPLGIAAVLLLEGKITLRGLHIPTVPELYEPILSRLAQEGILFEEKER